MDTMIIIYILTGAFFLLFMKFISNMMPQVGFIFRFLASAIAALIFFYISEAIHELITVKIYS